MKMFSKEVSYKELVSKQRDIISTFTETRDKLIGEVNAQKNHMKSLEVKAKEIEVETTNTSTLMDTTNKIIENFNNILK